MREIFTYAKIIHNKRFSCQVNFSPDRIGQPRLNRGKEKKMANIKSAIKRIRIAKRNRLKNLVYKDKIKKAMKLAMKSKTAEAVKAAISIMDKAAGKNIVSRNMAARKKSRLMKLVPLSK